MTKSTVPRAPIPNEKAGIENLRPENPFYKKYLANKNQTEEELNKYSNRLEELVAKRTEELKKKTLVGKILFH